MRVKKNIPGRKNEQGFIITLVAVFMLFVVGAMAALAIDVVTLYTARSEAQLAADSGALAGARVLANSGMTSDTTGGLTANAEITAVAVATQVATHNWVGGTRLVNQQVTVSFTGDGAPPVNPHVTVVIQVKTLPTFFARIWGNQTLAVATSATAEAYNPSATGIAGGGGPPVAPICVKPWLLPNMDPTKTAAAAAPIFGSDGSISNPNLVGQTWPNASGANPNLNGLYALCGGDCSGGAISPPAPGLYYPGAIDATDFPAPTQAVPACAAGFISYQMAVAGCVQQPISCGVSSAINPSTINIDQTPYPNPGGRDADTVQAAGCLIHYSVPGGLPGDADGIDRAATPTPPFEFLGGNQNPVTGMQNKPVVVTDSLVTIPVIDLPNPPGSTPTFPTSPTVTVIGFLQVLLNPDPTAVFPPPLSPTQIPAMIINMAGCGTSATGQPILGNGASPVAVRLISPP
jgi:hypothetical protein